MAIRIERTLLKKTSEGWTEFIRQANQAGKAVEKIQNEVARRKFQQQIESGDSDGMHGQAMSDALEEENRKLQEEAGGMNADRNFRGGGRPEARNFYRPGQQNRKGLGQDRSQFVPERMNNFSQFMQGAAKQQADAFNAQNGLNQQLVQGFQQAQQCCLAAMEQADRLAKQVQAMIDQGNAHARAMRGF